MKKTHLKKNTTKLPMTGNTGDQCAERTYTIGYYEILGFGIPAY